MKDRSYTEAWVDELVLRIRQLEHISPQAESVPPTTSNFEPETSKVSTVVEASMPPNCRFTRSSPMNLAALRNLPKAANILLLTPVIKLAERVKGPPDGETIDPFEAFGRALSQHHRRIRHVPFVAKIGFTDIHETFISQADAVITVVCEPEEGKSQSMEYQMDFAEAALDSLESKEANASHAMILVQCGDDEFRPPVDGGFMNVIESTEYNARIAEHVAHAIFKARV